MKSQSITSLVVTRSVVAAAVLFALAATAAAQDSNGNYTPVQLNSALPYRIEVRPYSMGQTDVPTLHSGAVGEIGDGKFLFIAGRTLGLHGFDCCISPEFANFPPEAQNRDIWVVDFANKQSWHRSLDDASSGLTEDQKLSLSVTNNQFYTKGNTLYMTGGYGVTRNSPISGPEFGTFNKLTAIDLDGLSSWVMGGSGTAAQRIRQIDSPIVKVTGGDMDEINGRTHLVFGQDFNGVYSPFSNGSYTKQVRSFDIVDDGVNLSIQNAASTPQVEVYRRRDLNVFPVLRPDGVGGLDEGLTVLSGVFTPGGTAWSFPVEIDDQGNPTHDVPDASTTFQQSMNVYHSAKLGMYSESRGTMNEVLFGGLTIDYLNPATNMIETDFQIPFVNDITSVVVDSNGEYSQHHLGFFPEILFGNLPLRFGTNAEFLLNEGIPTYENGVIMLDALHGEVNLGFIFGGIAADAPNPSTDPENLTSIASNYVFQVVIVAVPEPSSVLLAALCGLGLVATRRRRK